jgi:CheY-like chemotaxis protein
MSKVLVVDDDPDVIKAVTVVLESNSHEVASALTGEECLKKLAKDPPDLLILDVMMADADEGFEICRRVKKQPEWKHIPIMLLTALKDRTGFDFSKQSGDDVWCPSDAYLEKPIDPDKLIAMVDNLIGKSDE